MTQSLTPCQLAAEDMLAALIAIRKADKAAVEILHAEGFYEGPETIALWKLADDAIAKALAESIPPETQP